MPKHAETSEIIGKFGEYLVAFILAQRDVHVTYADTAGFDLLAVDPDKNFFSTDQVAGISVKMAATSANGGFDPKPPDGENLQRASRKWKAEPWLAYVSHWQRQGRTRLEVFLLRYEDHGKYMTKKGGAMSGDKLRKSGPEVKKFVAEISTKARSHDLLVSTEPSSPTR